MTNLIKQLSITFLLFSHTIFGEKMEILNNPIFVAERFHSPITVDGNLEEPGWLRAIGTDYFVEIDPGENVKPAEETLVKVGYDEENLYVAFWADANPEEIRASYQKRDQPWGDDFVAIFLDTYGDANVGTMIGSNAMGFNWMQKTMAIAMTLHLIWFMIPTVKSPQMAIRLKWLYHSPVCLFLIMKFRNGRLVFTEVSLAKNGLKSLGEAMTGRIPVSCVN
ncbi:MAG: hypothetical protein ISR83_00315 [Candidatus Marinimicrobia bacterium]|nr:hypothetical protein [Candidatus Neomarinimicrobiota bacterium]